MASGSETRRVFRGVALDVRPAVGTWTRLFARNNLLTYASAIAFQLFIALAILIFLAVALLKPLGAEHAWRATIAPALAARLPLEWTGAVAWRCTESCRRAPPHWSPSAEWWQFGRCPDLCGPSWVR
jgi:hypothetical protein